MLKKSLIIYFTALGLAASAIAGTEISLAELKRGATKGNSVYQGHLVVRYLNQNNKKEAIRWAKKFVKNCTDVQGSIKYFRDKGSDLKSLEILEMLATSCTVTTFTLAEYYLEGTGVKEDPSQSRGRYYLDLASKWNTVSNNLK